MKNTSTRMDATSNFTSRFSFQNAHMINVENRPLRYGSCILFYSHHRKTHSCIGRPSNTTRRCYTRPKLHCPLLFFQRNCDIVSYLNDGPIFSFLKMPIRLSCENRTEYCYAFCASFRDLLPKRTKYYAKQHYRAFFDLKQDVHIRVGRRRPYGTPFPTRSCVSRVTLTQ